MVIAVTRHPRGGSLRWHVNRVGHKAQRNENYDVRLSAAKPDRMALSTGKTVGGQPPAWSDRVIEKRSAKGGNATFNRATVSLKNTTAGLADLGLVLVAPLGVDSPIYLHLALRASGL